MKRGQVGSRMDWLRDSIKWRRTLVKDVPQPLAGAARETVESTERGGCAGRADGWAGNTDKGDLGESHDIRCERAESQAPVSLPNRAVRGRLKPKVCSRLERQLRVSDDQARSKTANRRAVEREKDSLTSTPAHHSQAEQEKGGWWW